MNSATSSSEFMLVNPTITYQNPGVVFEWSTAPPRSEIWNELHEWNIWTFNRHFTFSWIISSSPSFSKIHRTIYLDSTLQNRCNSDIKCVLSPSKWSFTDYINATVLIQTRKPWDYHVIASDWLRSKIFRDGVRQGSSWGDAKSDAVYKIASSRSQSLFRCTRLSYKRYNGEYSLILSDSTILRDYICWFLMGSYPTSRHMQPFPWGWSWPLMWCDYRFSKLLHLLD